MIVSSLTTQEIGPVAMAEYAISIGARVSGGTDMNTLAAGICKAYGLEYSTSSDEPDLLAHLQAGGMAIANVGGNRGGYTGVFSNGGHFIVVAKQIDDGRVAIMDPGHYMGKFNLSGRRGKVEIDGDFCYCDIDVLAEDCSNRSTRYWLFKKGVNSVPDWMKKIMDEAKALGLYTGEHNPTDAAPKWFVLAVALVVLKKALGK